MKRLCLAIILLAAPVALPFGSGGAWTGGALAQDELTARQAFDAAKELGTVEAWNAFLKAFPDGFFADLARAYVKKLGGAAE